MKHLSCAIPILSLVFGVYLHLKPERVTPDFTLVPDDCLIASKAP